MRESRIIFSDNGSLSDLSKVLNDPLAGNATLAITAAQDYIYLGSYFPFNHKHFSTLSTNQNASVISVQTWWANAWHECVDVIDETSLSGKTFGQSGLISWVPDRLKGWDRLDTNDPGGGITGLSSLAIYDLFWVRLKFSANLSATTSLKYIGQKFANDNDLRAEYPDLLRSGVLSQFAAGKTTWDDQHITAAEYIVKDLQSKRVVFSKDNLLEPSVFKRAAVHKCAEIIMGAFGDNYKDKRDKAYAEYRKALNVEKFWVDECQDAKINIAETVSNQGFMKR